MFVLLTLPIALSLSAHAGHGDAHHGEPAEPLPSCPWCQQVGGGQSAGFRAIDLVAKTSGQPDVTIGKAFVTGSTAQGSWAASTESWYVSTTAWPAAGSWPAQIDLKITYECYASSCSNVPGVPGAGWTLASRVANANATTPSPTPQAVTDAMSAISACIAGGQGYPGACSAYYYVNQTENVTAMVYMSGLDNMFAVFLRDLNGSQMFGSGAKVGDIRPMLQWTPTNPPSTAGLTNYDWMDPTYTPSAVTP